MSIELPRHTVDPTGRLIVRCRPEVYRSVRAAAWLWLPVGTLGLVMFVGVTWLVSYAFWGYLNIAVHVVATVACLAVSVGLPVANILGGLRKIRELREHDRLVLAIGPEGISRLNDPPLAVRWDHIRHIVVTGGKPGSRRLLVDDGTGTPARPRSVHIGLRDSLAYLAGRRRFTVDIPIDALNVEAGEVVRAIRHHSGGRLPDLFGSSRLSGQRVP